MNIQNEMFNIRDDELVSITAKDKKELLEICPNYYEPSKLEKLITGSSELEDAFEEFCANTETAHSYFNKKYYLSGLKDGFSLFDFLKK